MKQKQQQIYVTYKGNRKTIGEWAAILGVSRTALYQRIVRRGWPVTKAMETPFQKNAKPARDISIAEYTDEHDMEKA